MKTIIENTLWYSVMWILAYLLAGIIGYIVDRQYVSGAYRWLYNMTHDQPMDPTNSRGFIHGQKAARLFVIATIVSTVESLFLFFFTWFHSNPLVEIVLWLAVIPAMVLGFYFGQVIFPYWQKRQKVYDVLDKVEERLQRGAVSVTPESKAAPTEHNPTASAVPAAAMPEEDPRELINKFTKK